MFSGFGGETDDWWHGGWAKQVIGGVEWAETNDQQWGGGGEGWQNR